MLFHQQDKRFSKALQKGDNEMPLTTATSTILILAIALCTAATTTTDAALVASNEVNELQKLGNDKLQLINLRLANDKQVVVNDLLEQPETPNSLSDRFRQQQQQQQQQQPKLISQSNVINGNHATYVEPPADFKPIIYDYDKQKVQQVQKFPNEPSPSSSSSANAQSIESLESSNQLLPSRQQVASLSQQQQQQQLQAGVDPLMISSHDHSGGDIDRQVLAISGENYQSYGRQQTSALSTSTSGAELHKATNVAHKLDAASDNVMLKPSIGRWSDWHDMSIEPDLASSDSLESFQTVLRHYTAAGPYRTRYKSRPNSELTGTKSRASPAQQQVAQEEQQVQEQMKQPQVDIGRISMSVANQAANSKERSQPEQQAAQKSGQQSNGQVKGNKLTLNVATAVKGNSKQQLIKMQQQQQNELNQLQPSSGQTSGSFVAKPISAIAANPPVELLQQQQPARLQRTRRLKRRRKPKTNAEVRIQQLVAASQLQQQQQAAGKQVTGLIANQQASPVSLSGLPSQQSLGKRAPNFVVKRYGSGGAVPVAGGAFKATGSQQKEKKRRIKSQLPVGLSSWFLGGIRDLDGRHWQLPAEVVGRLAVNDVDLATGVPAAKVEPPSAGSVVILKPERESEQVPAASGSSAPVERTNQVPSAKVIPRR